LKEKLFEELGELLLGGDEGKALEILKKLMEDEDPEVKVASLAVVDAAMGRFHKIVEEVFPLVLRMALSDSHVYVRGNALEVVGKATHQMPETVGKHLPEVVSNIKSQSSDLAWNAVVALGWIGGSNPKLVAPFMDQIGSNLKSGSEIARSASAMAIGWIGGVSPELVRKYIPQLVEVAESRDLEEVRLSAIDALASISHANATLVEGFLEDIALIALRDENENVRGSALETIIEICKLAPEKAKDLTAIALKSASDEKETINWRIVVTLGFVGAGSPNTIPYMIAELAKWLKEAKSRVKATATLTIGWILGNNPEASAREAEKVIEAVAGLLRDTKPEVRRSAVEAIGWMSSNNPHLLKKYAPVVAGVAANDEDEGVRVKAEEIMDFMRERIKTMHLE